MRIENGIAYAAERPIIRVACVRPLAAHQLWLRFADGTEGVVDVTPLLASGVFARLVDETVFASVILDYGVPTWPAAGVDLAPEYLYQQAIRVEEPGGSLVTASA